MELPKIVFDDLYKFMVSLGIVLSFLSLGGIVYFFLNFESFLKLILISKIFLIIFMIISFIAGLWLIYIFLKKWRDNQDIYDETLREKLKNLRITNENSVPLKPDYNSYEDRHTFDFSKEEKTKELIKAKPKKKQNFALVDYKIDSSLPGTVTYDIKKDEKVWFWIANRESKKYKAYVKISFFILNKLIHEVKEGYYGGVTPWNLNAFTGIQAPGLSIPTEIKKAVKKNKKIMIKIEGIIKNEKDKLIEEKLPVSYVFENDKWYLEP